MTMTWKSQRFLGARTLLICLSLILFSLAFANAQVTQGTIGPIFSSRQKSGDTEKDKFINANIIPGEWYYSVRIVGSVISVPSTSFMGGLFKKASQVTMTSAARVEGFESLNPTQGINWVQSISPGGQYSLATRSFLVNYLPAQGISLAISIEYRVLEEGPATKFLERLSGFINSNEQPMAATLALSAGSQATLGTISAGTKVVSQIISALFPPETQRTTLKFDGSWQIKDQLKSGYYFILSAYDKQSLPSYELASKLKVQPIGDASSGQCVLVREDGKTEYNDTSYVILEVAAFPVLGKIYDPAWLATYDAAKEKAAFFATTVDNPTQQQRNNAWAVAEGLINQAKALAELDKRYLPSEKRKHYDVAYNDCMKLTLGKTPVKFTEVWMKTLRSFRMDKAWVEREMKAMQWGGGR